MEEIGEVTHYFSNISVAVINVKGNVKEGDKIRIKGTSTDFEQEVKSMQIDKKPITKAKKGDDIGLKVKDRVRPGDKVYKA